MKKIISIWICFFLFSCHAQAYSKEDLDSANFLASQGIIENYASAPSKYKFSDTITRRELLKIMIQISGKYIPTSCSTVHFQDLPASDWGCKYALIAVWEGYIAENVYFRPDDAITQIEALKMLMQAKGIERTHSIDWREWYITKAYEIGILKEKYLEYNTFAVRSWIFTTAEKIILYDTAPNVPLTQDTFSFGFSKQSIQVGEDIRWYKVFAPHENMQGRPMLMFLHGGMGNMDIIENESLGNILQDIATRDNILIVSPNASDPATWAFDGTKNNWNDYRSAEQNTFFQSSRATQYTENIDDVTFLNTLISELQEKYGISEKHVFVFGHSNGGLMTQRLLVDDGSRITAAAFLSSNVPKLQETKTLKYPVPVLLWLGIEDPLMKYPVQSDPEFPFLSGEASALWWAQKNTTNAIGNKEILTNSDAEGCSTNQVIYSGINPVYFYTAQWAGHTISAIKYPSEMWIFQKNIVGQQCHDIEEVEEVWNFFKSYIQ